MMSARVKSPDASLEPVLSTCSSSVVAGAWPVGVAQRGVRPAYLLLLALLGIFMPGMAVAQERKLDFARDIGLDQKLNEQVPLDLQFQNSQGQTVTLRKCLDGKPAIVALVYHECPMLCQLSQEGLISSLRALSLDVGQDFNVLTVSFDPREGPELSAARREHTIEYYGRESARTGWHFLTGSPESIRSLTEAVGFRYAFDQQSQQFAHPAGIVVLTPQGKISRYFYGVEYPPRDLRLGLVEASQQKIGSISDRVLLLCYHYDPATGKYGLAILNTLRAAGVLTVLSLACFIVYCLRRERFVRTRLVSAPGTSDSLTN